MQVNRGREFNKQVGYFIRDVCKAAVIGNTGKRQWSEKGREGDCIGWNSFILLDTDLKLGPFEFLKCGFCKK